MSDKNEARKEIMGVLDLLLAHEGPEYPALIEAYRNALSASRDYLKGEIELETTASGLCATCGASADTRPALKEQIDLDKWLARETRILVSNTEAAYRLCRIEVIQRTTSHLIADAALTGALHQVGWKDKSDDSPHCEDGCDNGNG